MAEHEAAASSRSLAAKLNHLNETCHPPGRGPYTLEESVAGIRAQGGAVSRTHLSAMRTGIRTNPSKSTIEAIARWYGVPAAYLLDDDPRSEITSQEHESLLILRRAELHELVRDIGRLRPETQRSLVRIVADLRAMQDASEQGDHSS
ncbi:hypothetical protein WIS52_20540 [Pseudonocardia nematodicida]|uniref:HTH cro/C1-type domain-containing protein n=1 Tax=Pseudonocardia nematodicida TaxID=1206997 RepID=A0ABV1KEG5_9PSEU